MKTQKINLGLIVMLLALLAQSQTAFAVDKDTFSNFSIVHADKLNFQQNGSELIGNVRIKFGEFTIAAPRVLVDTGAKSQSPELIRFVDEVSLKSDDLVMDAKTIEINLNTGLFKAFGDPEVISVWGKGKDRTEIVSKYQEYNLNTGLAKANSGGSSKLIKVTSPERDITAEEVELQNIVEKKKQGKDKIESINFSRNVTLVENDKRIEANNLYYWLVGDVIKAENNVKILVYSKEKDPVYIFSDLVTVEVDKDVVSASMNSYDRKVYVYSKDFVGNARHAYLKRLNKQPDEGVLTGGAHAQFKDKSITGEEILFDIQNKTLTSLVDRPKTAIYSQKEKTPDKKEKSSKRNKNKAKKQAKI